MADKGARAYLEPQALRMFADGMTLKAIAGQLNVSVTALANWKKSTMVPGKKMDEWDRTRAQKRGNVQRLRDLFEDQLNFLEDLRADERSAPMMDTLSKIGSLLERWDKMEAAQRVAENVVEEVKKAGISDETAGEIRRSILGIGS